MSSINTWNTVIVYDDDLIRYLSISLVNTLIAADFHFKNAWPITEDKIREMLFEMHMSFYLVSPVLYIDRTSDFFVRCTQLYLVCNLMRHG